MTEYATSKDGTNIGFQKLGSGPGIVLVQGAMGTAWNFGELARVLSGLLTVYVPDRRGRGLTPNKYDDSYTVQKEVEDLDALLAKTDAHFVYGLSSGGIIALQAALTLSSITKIAVYEPAFFVNGLPAKSLVRFDRQMAQGNIAAAMVTAMKAARMGPPALKYVPNWLMTSMVRLLLNQEARKGLSDYPSMHELGVALQYDLKIVSSMNDRMQTFKDLHKKVLLLGGSKSPVYLRMGLVELEKILPDSRRVEFAGLDHGSSWNYDKRRNPNGNPGLVAEELKKFFTKS